MYDKQTIEGYLRNYTILCSAAMNSADDEYRIIKMDLDRAMRKLQFNSSNLHKTMLGVFVYGNPIQEQARLMDVSKRQIIRRLDDGLHMLMMIMNGDVL